MLLRAQNTSLHCRWLLNRKLESNYVLFKDGPASGLFDMKLDLFDGFFRACLASLNSFPPVTKI